MAFNYINPSGIRLTEKEEKLLESIDNYPFELSKYKNLGELKQKLNVNVFLDDQKSPKYYPYKYKITATERKAIIDDLERELKRNESEVDALLRRWKNAHLNFDDAEVERIDREMRSCCMEKNRLENTLKKFRGAKTQKDGTYLVEGDADIIILGEYYSQANKVILYYNLIPSEELLAVVYVHEIIHAYLRGKGEECRIIKEIEEPIVESAMLRFFEFFDNGRLLGFATDNVKEKQYSLGIVFYGFGYYIYKNANVIDYLERYKKVKPQLLKTLPEVNDYLKYWRLGIYPNKQEQECLEALYEALHCVHINNNRQYIINGKGSYSMYGVVEEFVIFLQNLGHSISTINQEIQKYTNSTWIFVSSSPKTVAHFNKGEYPSPKGFYITKQWKGNTGGNFSKLMVGINSNYPNFQIIEM